MRRRQCQRTQKSAEDRAAVLNIGLDAGRFVVVRPAQTGAEFKLRRHLEGDIAEDVEGVGLGEAGLLLAVNVGEIGRDAIRDKGIEQEARGPSHTL